MNATYHSMPHLFYFLESSGWCRSAGFPPLLYHKSRSLLISRCLHSVSAPIFFPIQSSASWRCCCCCFICSLCPLLLMRLKRRRRLLLLLRMLVMRMKTLEQKEEGGSKATVREATVTVTASGLPPTSSSSSFSSLLSPPSSTTSVRHPSQGKTPCARRPTHRLHRSIRVHQP